MAEQQLAFPYARASTMKDTEFMTGKEKMRVLHDWESFLKNGCDRVHFTKALYHHLEQHCSFIAHYDINGFYETYFEEPDDTVTFLTQFDRSKGLRSCEIGLDYWVNYPDMNDINNAMCDIAGKYIPALVSDAGSRQRDLDVKRARLLLAKHGIQIKE